LPIHDEQSHAAPAGLANPAGKVNQDKF